MIDTNWQSFLKTRGFSHTAASALQAPRTAPSDRPTLLDLSQLGMLEVGGEEAFDFLQGQLSNDLRPVMDGASQLSAYCNPKGRVLALFRVVRSKTGFGLIAPSEVLHSVLPRLRMYVLRAKVNIETPQDFVAIGAAGAGMAALLLDTIGNAPQPGQTATTTELIIAGIANHRWLINGSPAAIRNIWEQLENEATSADSNAWRRLNILDGLPQVFASTAELFIPQTINLDLVDGVSFSKGCYPGQEIVARLRYLGKIKQRMICTRLPELQTVAIGDPVYSLNQGDRRVGTVVDAQPDDCGMLLLISAPVSEFVSASLRLSPNGGNFLERVELPYTIPEEQSNPG